jgi:hypothetical protein
MTDIVISLITPSSRRTTRRLIVLHPKQKVESYKLTKTANLLDFVAHKTVLYQLKG